MAFKSNYRTNNNVESPEALFYDLRNRKVEGLLAHQADVLRVYMDNVKNKNVALELPTGSGKTLIGLLIAEYRRRVYKERAIFLCPTKQLVNQVVEEANIKYGIKAIAFTGSQASFNPKNKAEYSNSEAVAVTTYSSLFNTNPFFYNPDFIVVDDAHAAENYIVKHWSLTISRFENENIYMQLLEMFKNSMPYEQYARMKTSSPTPSDKEWVEKIPTPYFVSNHTSIVSYLDESTKGIKSLEYNWSVIRNYLSACHLYFNYNSILIRPIIPPTTLHLPFSNANQRLYMSATLGMGGELERITGQNNITRIKAPEGWDKHGVGRRLFFFPGTTLSDLDTEKLVSKLATNSNRSLILVPDNTSAESIRTRFAESMDTEIYCAVDIEQSKDNFVNSNNAVAILANRYDGINLVGDECRLQIMYGLPSSTNLQEKFLESRMSASLLLQDRIRTRIVQAIGRCTRGATDYSTVCIIGDQLQDRLLQSQNIKLYHSELQAELAFGYEESKEAQNIEDFIEMYQIFLKQDDEWNSADNQIVSRRMDKTREKDPLLEKLQDVVKAEIKYVASMWSGDFKSALEYANTVANGLDGDGLKGYRGFWNYLAGSAALQLAQSEEQFQDIAKRKFEQAANSTYSVTWFRHLIKESSNKEELSSENHYLSYLIENLENELEDMGISSDRKFEKRITSILEGLSSNENSKKFEAAHKDLGKLLGYNADNTEENSGPDPWWTIGNEFCLVAEDYTETDGEKPIPTYKIRQLNDHPKWLQRKIENLSTETEFVRILISPSTKIEHAALDIADESIYYWNQNKFKLWAQAAIQTVRELRLEYCGKGNEEWRLKAAKLYQEAGIDPYSIKTQLSESPLDTLEKL
ncbi:DEAD/DEAH box helicase [Lysinibacillus sp. NPDC056232]|uniref:DEAD/DEAH box helicase n=1 Tax=Lysinibacillus sp. NPDC056232 TaxID=3345756 RepID=UPI0035D879BC